MEPIHPLFVHLPIALASLMPLIAAGLLLTWHKGWLPRRAFAIAVILQVILVGSGIAARQTGEMDEERVEQVVREAAIEAHEEAADLFLYGAGGALLLGRFVPWWPRVGALLPIMVLAFGSLLLADMKQREDISVAVEIDAALLADDLPPEAYADPGFVAFLKLQQP